MGLVFCASNSLLRAYCQPMGFTLDDASIDSRTKSEKRFVARRDGLKKTVCLVCRICGAADFISRNLAATFVRPSNRSFESWRREKQTQYACMHAVAITGAVVLS